MRDPRARLVPLAVLAVCIAATAACREPDRKESGAAARPAAKTTDFFSCAKSSDCVLENQQDCCPCNAGGRQVAVRKKSLDAYRAARAARCTGDLLCPQVYLCDDKASAVCGGGRCAIAGGGAAGGH
jgi:hypothetical protein